MVDQFTVDQALMLDLFDSEDEDYDLEPHQDEDGRPQQHESPLDRVQDGDLSAITLSSELTVSSTSQTESSYADILSTSRPTPTPEPTVMDHSSPETIVTPPSTTASPICTSNSGSSMSQTPCTFSLSSDGVSTSLHHSPPL